VKKPRYAFSSRSVIKQDVSLQCDQVKLPFHGLCELLQQVIINILVRSYNITYAEAYKKWFKAQITGNDQAVYDIIDGLIKDSENGLPVLINRNPTISYGGVLAVHVVGINMDYTMSVSLLILKILAADFDKQICPRIIDNIVRAFLLNCWEVLMLWCSLLYMRIER
jgi:DNA-directed RNA polymerase beta' subunit